jgi:hypothetical protein
MKIIIACLIAVLFVSAGTSVLGAGEIEVPNGIYVKGCPDYTLVDNRVQQLCDIDSIHPRNFLSVTEFDRAFRGTGGRSEGGSESIGSPSD